ncbi:MAG TPA: phosphopentomutase [Actinomycetota bacterium]|nr:phosphopentomutase [Actinomycetota bacterium]
MPGGTSAGVPARAVVLIVLDSVGIGGAPDAADFGDAGSATLPHVASAVGGIGLPHLADLGLGNLAEVEGVPQTGDARGAFGILTERSAGKDTTTGHWELMGVVLDDAFPTYPQGFPDEIIAELERRTGRSTLGNKVASGTEIIDELGEEHMRTGAPIVYTSADSVFQIAAHEGVVPLDELYEICRAARAILSGPHEVGRVIARPFVGAPGAFERTPNRHDFSRVPPVDTVLDEIVRAGLEVRGVGKIHDIFAGRGVSHSRPTRSNADGVDAVIAETEAIGRGLVFANLVDFDQSYGHRNDPAGYARALEEFDSRLPEILAALADDDILIVTADHGNDPTTPSTDHSRERVPLLAAGARVAHGTNLGVRSSFADCGATIADLLRVPSGAAGSSFADEILRTASA